MDISSQIDAGWAESLQEIWRTPWFQELARFVGEERIKHQIFPPNGQVFTALKETPFRDVKVVVIGQDPYHGAGQAHGLSFSVSPGTRLPPSLRNIYQEVKADLECETLLDGSLLPWAHQGVLLLNAVLTVRCGEPGSHQGKGWEKFTDAVIAKLWTGKQPVAFVAWGRFARETLCRAQGQSAGAEHLVIESAHPSPFSAHQGFFGSKPFSRINRWLIERGNLPIQWGKTESGGSN